MIGVLLLNIEIFLGINIIILIIMGVILNEKRIKSYNYMNYKIMQSGVILVVVYSIIMMYNTVYYEAMLLNYQIIYDNIAYLIKLIVLGMTFLILVVSINYSEVERIKSF